MHVWLVATYEPIVGLDEGTRALRFGMLADALLVAGHSVTWWTSTFHHVQKRNRFPADHDLRLPSGLELRLLHGPGYQRNISFGRMRHNDVVAARFRVRAAQATPRPDVILAALPTPNLAEAAVEYGRAHGVPVLVDARDQWPDIFVNPVPSALRPLARLALAQEFRRARRLFRAASGVTAVSESYLAWGLAYSGRSRGPNDAAFSIGYPSPDPAIDFEAPARAVRLRARLGLPPEALLATFVGMFGQSYDVETLVEAARILHARGDTRVRLVLAGDGDKRAALEQRAVGVPNVVFTGWLDQPDVWALLRDSAIGLVAYRADAPQSLPNKPYEFMAAGLALASSLRGELDQIIAAADNGVRYAAGDAATLAGHLAALADNPARMAAMRANSAAVFRREFATDVIYPLFVAHLERAARATPFPR